jgi:phage shock protein A
MGFFNRVSEIIAANINDLLDKMEEPERMMRQLVREMETAVATARENVVKTLADEKRVEKEIAAQKAAVDEWQARAVAAVERERDDLARKALEFKHEAADVLAALECELESASAAAAGMKTQYRALQARYNEARRKQATLAARMRSAQTQRTAAAPAAGRVKAGAFAEFDRMTDKVAVIEAEAEAMAEIGAAEKSVRDEFAEMEAGDALDSELAAIKGLADKV